MKTDDGAAPPQSRALHPERSSPQAEQQRIPRGPRSLSPNDQWAPSSARLNGDEDPDVMDGPRRAWTLVVELDCHERLPARIRTQTHTHELHRVRPPRRYGGVARHRAVTLLSL